MLKNEKWGKILWQTLNPQRKESELSTNHLKAVLKNFDKAIEEGDFETAQEKLKLAEKKLKQAAAKHTISKNAASRKVSRLAKRFNAAKAAK